MMRRRGGAGEKRGGGGLRGGGQPAGTRYKMREKLVAIGDDFYIEDGGGRRVFKVDGKALRVRKTLIFEDLNRNELCRIQERMLRIKDTMNIERDGNVAAKVKKALITPVRMRFSVKVGDGSDMSVTGNILHHEYKIESGGQKIAEVSKKWFRVRNMYGVEIAPGQDDILILACTVAIDMMAHQ